MADALRRPLKFLRGGVSRGLASAAQPAIDPTGGDSGAGIIRGMAVITRGEALGHDLWIDQEFLQQVADGINSQSSGAKARFTHPGLSGDGLGKYLGRAKNAVVDGEVVRADLHFSQSAHDTPDGDLADYLLTLAESDPAAFGNSIAFAPDRAAMQQHMIGNGAEWKSVDDGPRYLSGFVSPDPGNTDNLPHARLEQLRAVDVVDEPAANPNGLFHRGQEMATEAEGLFSYALGLSAEAPDLVQLDLDPDRISGFVSRFLDRHNLAIVPKQKERRNTMSLASQPAAAEIVTADPAADPAAELSAAPPAPVAPVAADGARFLAEFGDRGGVWFAQGLTFEQAGERFIQELRAANERLTAEVAELRGLLNASRGEATPIDVGAGAAPAAPKRFQNLSPGAAQFASSLDVILAGRASGN